MTASPAQRDDADRIAADGIDSEGKAVRRPGDPPASPVPPAAGAIDRADPPEPNNPPPDKEGSGTPNLDRRPASAGVPDAKR